MKGMCDLHVPFFLRSACLTMPDAKNHNLQTARLLLRPAAVTDALEIATLANDIIIAQMTARIPHPYRLQHAADWLKSLADGHETAFVAINGKQIVGVGGVTMLAPHRAEIGYWVGEPFRRRGFAKEIAGALIDFTFSRAGTEELVVSHFIDNTASERVIKSFGFTFLEFIDLWSVGRGLLVPTAVYLMTREEAEKRHR